MMPVALLDEMAHALDAELGARFPTDPVGHVTELLTDDVLRNLGHAAFIAGTMKLYPFGGLDGLLAELEQSLRAGGADCENLEQCGPLGCLLAKLYHVRTILR